MSRPLKGQTITDSTPPRTRREARNFGTLSDLDRTLELDFGSGDENGGDDDGARGSRRRRRWPWVVLIVFLLLVAAAAVAGLFALQALQVKDDLAAAKSRVAKIVPMVKDGDVEGAKRLSDEVLTLTASADETVNGPLWAFASQIPWVGANVTAVSETTQATHILVRDAMPLALELLPLANVENFKVEGGGISLEPFRAAQPKLPALRQVFDEAKSHVDRIQRDEIHPLVAESIQQLVDIVDDAGPTIAFAEQNLPLVLSVLGGDGPRSYALMFQNLAETRSTGGNPASGVALLVDDGKVTLREDPAALRYLTAGPGGAYPQYLQPDEKSRLFESDTWKYWQNYTRPPDFSDTAHMMAGLWGDTIGGSVDGVISLDPVVLSYMLSVTGPVTVPGEGGEITAKNAVKLLLSDTYERYRADGSLADAYFAKVSAAVFSKVMSGGWDPLKMIEQLQKAADEQRVYAWFANENEQAMAVELGIDGVVPADSETVTQTGIYLNDAAYSKLEYYLSTSMKVTCSAEKRTMTTSVTMSNAVPGSDLSGYVLGARNYRWDYPPTTMLFDVIGMSLPGGELLGSSPSAGERSDKDRTGVYNGRQTKSMVVSVPMGESKTVSFTSSIPDGTSAPLEVRFTPTVTETPVTVDASCGELFPENR
ncbi:DUF4012 domain-containing protein [Microbacterium sp. NPDC058345]|uniref:DUF4012 domain-containing protein n=1 Tax=Microbacterium sp. NPDC058345 TaxID=3346455 RepID=UPI003649642B